MNVIHSAYSVPNIATTSVTATFGFTPTVGNILIVAACNSQGEFEVFNVPAGYTVITPNSIYIDGINPIIAYKVSDGTETTVTLSLSSGDAVPMAVAVIEVSPMGAVDRFAYASSGGTPSTLNTGPTAAQSSASDTALAFWLDRGNGAASGVTFTNNYTLALNGAAIGGSKTPSIVIAARDLSTNGTTSCTATPASAFSGTCAAAVVTFLSAVKNPSITSASLTLTQKKVIAFTGLWAVGATTDKTLWHVKQSGITRTVGGVTLTSTTSGEIDMTDYLVLGVPFTVSVEEGGINDTGGDSAAVTETTGTNSSTDVIDCTSDVTWVFSNGWNAVLAQGGYLQQLCGATPCEPSPNFPEPAAGGTYIFNVVLASDHATVVATTSKLFGPIGQIARGILPWLKSWLPWL